MKVDQDPFSNGEEYRWWTANNCDGCIKSPVLDCRTGELIRKSRCYIFNEIDKRMYCDDPITQRTIDACQKARCPYRQTTWPVYKRKHKSKTANLPSLFKEEIL